MIEGIIASYLMGSLMAAMLWPMVRDIITEGHTMLRREGETGLMFIGRTILIAAVWPIPTVWLLYRFITEMVIPWLTEPA